MCGRILPPSSGSRPEQAVHNGVKLLAQRTPADPYAGRYVLLRLTGEAAPPLGKPLTPTGVHFGGPKMDEKGLAGRKWPELPARSTEIYQTHPPFVGLRQDKFRSFRERGSPGGHFLKAGGRQSGGIFDFQSGEAPSIKQLHTVGLSTYRRWSAQAFRTSIPTRGRRPTDAVNPTSGFGINGRWGRRGHGKLLTGKRSTEEMYFCGAGWGSI